MVASSIKQQIKDIDEGLAEFSESEKKEFGSKLIAKKEELQKQLKELEDAEKAAAKPAPTPEKKKEAKKEVVKEVKQSKELVKKTSKILDKLKEKVKQTKPKVEPKKPISIVKTAKAKAVATKKVVEPKAKKTSSAAIDRARKIAMKYRKKQNISTAKGDLERDAQRAALPAGKRITDGSNYPYIKGNVYYENRENRTDRNPKKYPRLEEGGDVSGEHHYKVNLKYWVADVYEDNYEEGEGDHVNSFDGKVHKTFEFVDDLIRYISTNILYKDVSKEDFDIQDGVMSTSMLVDEANVAATDSEIELWKEDEMKLYSANYSFYVQLVEEKEATEEELREMLGLQGGGYSSMFKEGSQVRTTVFMSTEDIGGDEDIEVGTIGVVMAEPMDDEQLVQVQLAGGIHYLPQYVLEVVSDGMMAKGGKLSNIEFVEKTIVYDNGGKTLDRYTVFTPDGSVYGMSENASGFNQYLGEKNEIPKGSHLGKKLNNVPKEIEWAVIDRMETFAKGGSLKYEGQSILLKTVPSPKEDRFLDTEIVIEKISNNKIVKSFVRKTGEQVPFIIDEKFKKEEYATGKTFYGFGGSLMKEWDITITSKDGETFDWTGYAKNEDEALMMAESEAGFESVETGINMVADEHGNKIDYAKGGSLDADRFAKPSGWRWKNSAVEDGIISRASLSHSPSLKMRRQYPDYVAFENRPTKSDKHPSRRYQSLEHGGTLDKNGLMYSLTDVVSSGTIGNITGMHNYKDIDAIRATAIEILERDGDREYSMENLKAVLLEAKDGNFKSGGMFSSSRPKSAIARDRKYTSQQEWEKDYVRKASPRMTYREGKYEGGGEMHKNDN